MASSMAVDNEKLDVDAYLTTALSSSPQELHPFFESFRSLHERKLWHQLTGKLFEFFRTDLSRPYRVDVFDRFIRDFEQKLNQLRLVELGVIASKEIDNPVTQLNSLQGLLGRVDTKASPEAHVLLLSSLAQAKLSYSDIEGTATDMEAAWKILDDLDGVDPAVNAAYYSIAADYYKAKGDFGPYYKNSLLYLACIDPATDLTNDERMFRAHDLGVAALLGETIYNFGELLMHPILSSLDGTGYEWIKKLLFVFNSGDIGKFESTVSQLPKEPILSNNYPFLHQKICLMALIESVFQRNADSRTLSFQTIAQETRLDVREVEHLVMKAFSLSLLRGTIDQISETATFTWVQPRVLGLKQIGALSERLNNWTNKLKEVEQRIAPEMVAAA